MRKMHDLAGAGSLPVEAPECHWGTLSLSGRLTQCEHNSVSASLVLCAVVNDVIGWPLPAFFERWS
jgi:hypothetical protein